MGSVALAQTVPIMRFLLLLTLGISLSLAVHDFVLESANNDFSGFKVYRTLPTEEYQTEFLENLQETSKFYDFWSDAKSRRAVDIMTSPGMDSVLEAELDSHNIAWTVMISNVQELINKENAGAVHKDKAGSGHSMTWDDYHSLEDMYSYFDYLETTFSDIVSTEVVGQSYEGRDIRVAKVCKGGCGNKKAVWIDGGIHAREWVSPATVTWMLKEVVENDSAHPDLTETLDWYFLPSHNPDGYAYTRDHNRMWRKTRSDNGGILGCKGADANRNYGHHWNEGGSSNDKCSDTYHGPAAWSEIETVHVSNYILQRQSDWIFYNSIHSYSQLVLLPWGYTNDLPDDYQEMFTLAQKGADALTSVHGKTYEVGCIPCMLYIASGSSTDWAHGEVGIGFTTSMELRDTGLHGFLLPADQIIPTAEETWAFHETVIRELMTQTP